MYIYSDVLKTILCTHDLHGHNDFLGACRLRTPSGGVYFLFNYLRFLPIQTENVQVLYIRNLYIWLTILSCYGSIPWALGLIGRDGDLSTLCHSCGFACQHRVLKTFPGRGYLHSEDGVV